jgi:hypothetical protein
VAPYGPGGREKLETESRVSVPVGRTSVIDSYSARTLKLALRYFMHVINIHGFFLCER